MSLAENLLNNMENDFVAYNQEDLEPHITIDESRIANVPQSLRTIAVTGDKDILTIPFDCARFIDGHDLSTFAIYLNYVLPDGTDGTYIPDSITTSDAEYHFEWLIKNNITKTNGKIYFAITAIKTKQNDDGKTVVDKQWSSIPNGDCAIALGLDISNVPTDEETPDVVSQLSAILEKIHGDVDEWIKNVLVQTTGDSETSVMSQKTVTQELYDIGYKNLTTDVNKKTTSAIGNNLIDEYIDGEFTNEVGTMQKLDGITVARAVLERHGWYQVTLFQSPFEKGFYTAFKHSNGSFIEPNENLRKYFVIDEETNLYGVYVPEGTRYLYFNINTSDKELAVCKELQTSFKIPWVDITPEDESVTFAKINTSLNENATIKEEIAISRFDDGYYTCDGIKTVYSFSPSISIAHATVESGKTYIISLYENPFLVTGWFVDFFTESGEYLGHGNIRGAYSIEENLFYVTAPNGASLVKFNVYTDNKEQSICMELEEYHEIPWLKVKKSQIVGFEEPSNNDSPYTHCVAKPYDFSGKSIVAFGDSITYGALPNLSPSYTKPYIQRFTEAQGANLDNRAVSGSFICDINSANSITNKILSYQGGADVVFVAGGCNDYNFNKNVGEYGDTDGNSFYGCLHLICTHLAANFPNTNVYFITPINQSCEATGGGTHDVSLYRNAIFEVATSFGFNVVDGSKIGFPTKKGTYRYKTDMIYDGVHPTAKGHAMYARALSGIIVSGAST